MKDSICRAYSALLRSVDPRLGMEAAPSERDPSRRVYWITFSLDWVHPLKLTTLEAGVRWVRSRFGLPQDWQVGPGAWVREFIRASNYEYDTADARHQLSYRTH